MTIAENMSNYEKLLQWSSTSDLYLCLVLIAGNNGKILSCSPFVHALTLIAVSVDSLTNYC